MDMAWRSDIETAAYQGRRRDGSRHRGPSRSASGGQLRLVQGGYNSDVATLVVVLSDAKMVLGSDTVGARFGTVGHDPGSTCEREGVALAPFLAAVGS